MANYSLKEFEPLQYTIYKEGDFYDWHIDSHAKSYDNGMIRKLSFTLCLNEDYEGGNFSVSSPHPISEKTKIEKIDKPKKGTMIVFPSYTWHKVDKVTSGIRKTLVGWVKATMVLTKYIVLEKKNEVYLTIDAEDGIRRDIGEYFTFEVWF